MTRQWWMKGSLRKGLGQEVREMGVEKKNYSSYSFKKSMIMDPS